MAGRPSKLNKQIKKRLIDAISRGSYLEPACRAAGIHYATFRAWMKKGEQAKSGQFREFYEEVIQAEAEAEQEMIKQWQAQIPTDWRAAKDFLARRYPERWANKDHLALDHSGEVTQRHEGSVGITQQLIGDTEFLAAIQKAAEEREDPDPSRSDARSMGPGNDRPDALEQTDEDS